MKKTGKLCLIPTPIDEDSQLNIETFKLLDRAYHHEKENSLFVVEDLKPGRRRWIHFGLNREAVNEFYELNEHNFENHSEELLEKLKLGFNIYLMSDGGLPAFCDPGRELVYLAHKNNIKVTSAPFFNSVILALALSGLDHKEFQFLGFLPKENEHRKKVIATFSRLDKTAIVMDTPYRLKRLLEEMKEIHPQFKKEIFLAMDLNTPTEELYLKPIDFILSTVADFKREFVLIISK